MTSLLPPLALGFLVSLSLRFSRDTGAKETNPKSCTEAMFPVIKNGLK